MSPSQPDRMQSDTSQLTAFTSPRCFLLNTMIVHPMPLSAAEELASDQDSQDTGGNSNGLTLSILHGKRKPRVR